MVNLIKDVRREFNSPKMAVSIPVSGFDGWMQVIEKQHMARLLTKCIDQMVDLI
jgi:hypothetical protein